MPLFDFKCPACGRVEEVLVRADTVVPKCAHLRRMVKEITTDGGENNYELSPLVHDVFTMERQFPDRTGPVEIKGFSSINGYSRTDTGYQPSQYAGIKTRIHD